MANAKYDGKYLRCDISFVRDAVVGGRLYSAEINEEVLLASLESVNLKRRVEEKK